MINFKKTFFKEWFESIQDSNEILTLLKKYIEHNFIFVQQSPPEEQAEEMLTRIFSYGGHVTDKIITHYADNRDLLVNDVQSILDELKN